MTQASVSFSSPCAELSALGDSDLLKSLSWERGADPALRSAAAAGDVNAFVAACQRRCDNKKSDYSASILWSRPAFPDEAELIPLLEDAAGVSSKPRKGSRRPANKTTRNFAQRVESLIYALTGEPQTVQTANAVFALLTGMDLLADSGGRLRSPQYWRLWRYSLIQAVRLTASLSDESDPTVPADVDLMERGEIPFVAGLLFAGIEGSSKLVKSARKAISRELVDGTDTDGTPHADLVERLPLWLAPLVRATRIATVSEVRLWTRDQEQLLKSLVERAIPLCRPDGRAALSNGLQLQPLAVLVAAAETCGLPEMGSVGSYLRSVKRVASGKSPARARSDGVLSMPSNQSDFARFALLRSDWTVKADSVALAHHRKFPQLDVTAAGKPLIHGDWTLRLSIGGVPVELADEWVCCCWQSDPDADYIELQMQGPGKLRVERIVMLSRTQRFLLLADSIGGVPRERIEYQSELSLGDSVQAQVDGPTREVRLTTKGLRSRACPLAIPQDRIVSTPHSFTAGDGKLTLNHVVQGEGLFAPILLEWDPDRWREPSQWRSLTVTEDSHVIGNDIASGHRLKVNDLHLLVFRSLKATGQSRAVLGHHTFNETVVARVNKKGDVDPILSVE